MDKQTSSRITILGFLMTSVIVMYHCGATGVAPLNILDEKINKFLDIFFDNMAILAMSYFFFVTGYLLFYNLTESLFKIKIKRRFFTLIIPYILWQIVTVVYYIILGRFNGWTIRKLVNTVFLMQLWPPDGAVCGVSFSVSFTDILISLQRKENRLVDDLYNDCYCLRVRILEC